MRGLPLPLRYLLVFHLRYPGRLTRPNTLLLINVHQACGCALEMSWVVDRLGRLRIDKEGGCGEGVDGQCG